MSNRKSWIALLKRLRWDLQDKRERIYYGYWFIWQLPGVFGIQLRSRYLASRMDSAGANLQVLAGCRFRSLEKLQVGRNVNIGYDNFLQARGGLFIGDNVSLAPGVKIWSTNHNYDDPDTPVEEQGHTHAPVHIGDNVFIASNAFILPGVSLPEGCIVCAGTVVGNKPYHPYSILAGNPARAIGYRGGRSPDAKTRTKDSVKA